MKRSIRFVVLIFVLLTAGAAAGVATAEALSFQPKLVAGVPVNARTAVPWAKCTLTAGTYKYVVYATDAAGNAQKTAGGAKLVVR